MPDLIITEHAMKRHCKRLQDVIRLYNPDVPLMDAQNIFAKILGFKDYHHIKQVLDTEPDLVLDTKSSAEITFLKNVTKNLKKQCSEADNINREYIGLLSKLYIFNQNPRLPKRPDVKFNPRDKAEIEKSNTLLRVYREKEEALQAHKISEIMHFVDKHKKYINFELTNREGLPLLYLLIYLRYDTPLRMELLVRTKELSTYYTNPLLYLLFQYYSTDEEKDYILSKNEYIKSFTDRYENRHDLLLICLSRPTQLKYIRTIFYRSTDLPREFDVCCWNQWFYNIQYKTGTSHELLIKQRDMLVSIGLKYNVKMLRSKYLSILDSYEKPHIIDANEKSNRAFEILKILIEIDVHMMSKGFINKLIKHPYLYDRLKELDL